MGTDPVIYIRTDGNAQIATGHLVRCLSIARALRTRLPVMDVFIVFLVSDQESKALLSGFFDSKEEFPVRVLQSAHYDDLEAELPELLSLVDKPPVLTSDTSGSVKARKSRPVLLVDSYYVTEAYFEALKEQFTIAYLDDLRAFDYPVDLVINYDILTPKIQQEYEHSYSRAGKLLLGGTYAPLRAQFQSKSGASAPAGEICHVLIASGGSDPYHTTLHLTEYLLAECPPGCCFDLVLGSMNPDRQALSALAEHANSASMESSSVKNSKVILHQGISDMASLMRSCDLAISAAGTTLYELCAVGIPSASFIIADNQIASANAFAQDDVIPCLGDVRNNEESVKKEAALWVTSMNPYVKNQAASVRLLRYRNISRRMQQLVDGNGAIRIADALLDLPSLHS